MKKLGLFSMVIVAVTALLFSSVTAQNQLFQIPKAGSTFQVGQRYAGDTWANNTIVRTKQFPAAQYDSVKYYFEFGDSVDVDSVRLVFRVPSQLAAGTTIGDTVTMVNTQLTSTNASGAVWRYTNEGANARAYAEGGDVELLIYFGTSGNGVAGGSKFKVFGKGYSTRLGLVQ